MTLPVLQPPKVKNTRGCDGCPMQRKYPEGTFVAPTIGTGLRLVVAEAPGSEEEIQGKPLVGGAGKWFDIMLSKAGIKRDTLTLCNVLNCRPPDNLFPTDPDARKYISEEDAKEAVGHCLEAHMLPLLEGRPWKRIDMLGEKALRYVAGKTEGIYKWRGSPLEIDTDDIRKRAKDLQRH